MFSLLHYDSGFVLIKMHQALCIEEMIFEEMKSFDE